MDLQIEFLSLLLYPVFLVTCFWGEAPCIGLPPSLAVCLLMYVCHRAYVDFRVLPCAVGFLHSYVDPEDQT